MYSCYEVLSAEFLSFAKTSVLSLLLRPATITNNELKLLNSPELFIRLNLRCKKRDRGREEKETLL